jgi:hypothetical protein
MHIHTNMKLIFVFVFFLQTSVLSKCNHNIKLNSNVKSFNHIDYPLSTNLYNWLNSEDGIKTINTTLFPYSKKELLQHDLGIYSLIPTTLIVLNDKVDKKYSIFYTILPIIARAIFLGLLTMIGLLAILGLLSCYFTNNTDDVRIFNIASENNLMPTISMAILIMLPLIIIGIITKTKIHFDIRQNIWGNISSSNTKCNYCMYYSIIDDNFDVNGKDRYCLDHTLGSVFIDEWIDNTFVGFSGMQQIGISGCYYLYILICMLLVRTCMDESKINSSIQDRHIHNIHINNEDHNNIPNNHEEHINPVINQRLVLFRQNNLTIEEITHFVTNQFNNYKKCTICLDELNYSSSMDDFIEMKTFPQCNHSVCKECFNKMFQEYKKQNKEYYLCPICREPNQVNGELTFIVKKDSVNYVEHNKSIGAMNKYTTGIGGETTITMDGNMV